MKHNNLFVIILLIMLITPMYAKAESITLNVQNETELKSALTNVTEETIVNITEEIEVTSKVQITGNGKVTINGNGNKVYSTGNNTDRVFELKAGDELLDVTFENMTIENAFNGGTKAARGVDTRTDNITLTFNNVTINTPSIGGNNQPITIGGSEQDGITVNINNSYLNAGNSGYAVISFVKANINVDNSTLEGYAAIYMKEGSANSVIAVNNSILTSNNTHNGESNRFGTIVFEDENIILNIIDSTVEAVGTGDAYQAPFINGANLDESASTNKVTVSGDKSVIKVENAVEVPQVTDEETGEVVSNSNEFAYNNTALDITFNAGVTTNVIIEGNIVETIPTDYLPDNTVIEENENGTLVVAVKHNITVNSNTDSQVELDKVTAVKGEVVTITTTADENYELTTLKVVDTDNNEITVTDGKFTMPNTDVTVTAEFKEVADEPVPPTYDNINLYIILASISLLGLTGLSIYNKNKKLFN